jgi:hypothetical protein
MDAPADMMVGSVASRRRFQFGMRTMLLLVLASALLLWFGRVAYQRYNSIALRDAISAFNVRVQNNSVGKHEPPLTESEVIAAINEQLPTLDATAHVRSIYRRIAATGRLPLDAELDEIPGYQPRNGPSRDVWWINLNVMTGPTSGYGLRIRETNDPKVASALTSDTLQMPQ